MSSILGLSFLFLYTWLFLSDKCHFNLVFSSSHVEPTYNLPSSNIILYILPFLYRLLNLLFVSSNVGCSLVTYLLFSSLKFRRMNSNLLVRDNAVYNCFLIYALDIIYIIVLKACNLDLTFSKALLVYDNTIQSSDCFTNSPSFYVSPLPACSLYIHPLPNLFSKSSKHMFSL